MEIVPGLHQIVLPVPAPNTQLNEVNAYLVEGRDGWLLVDTGWNTRHTFAVLEEQLGQIGVGVGDISQILITHFHPDHYGLVGKLKQLSPAKVALHEVEIAFIESRYIDMDSLLAEIAELLRLHGVPEEELPRLQKASLEVRQYVLPFSPEIGLRGGETIAHGDFNFEVIWTPGHSPGHVCLYEPKHRILLSGDHLLPTIFSNIALHPQSGKDPLRNYLSSLSVIEQLDVGLVLPAHEYVFAQPGQRIKEIRRHHQERKAAIINVLKERAQTAYEIAFKIPWIMNGVTMSFGELPALDKRLAVMSALAHLEPLCDEGKAEKIQRDGILFYGATGVP